LQGPVTMGKIRDAGSKGRRAMLREVLDAYSEGLLDGIDAERRRATAPCKETLDVGTNLHRQLDSQGRTLESLLAAPDKTGRVSQPVSV
jgi:hypothetical protein